MDNDPWRAQREHAQGEALIEALNLTFYRRCKALGIATAFDPFTLES